VVNKIEEPIIENVESVTDHSNVEYTDNHLQNLTTINYNKPWRVVIRRIVSDGGNNYEDIYGEQNSNQSM